MWDIIVLGTYLILSIVYLWAMLRFEGGKGSAAALRVVSAIALVCAVLVHSVTAWIFGLQQGREMWHTALLGPWFVSSALVCGVALVLVVVIALRKAGYLELAQEHVVKMLKLLGVFVMVDLYFFGCDLLTEGFQMCIRDSCRTRARWPCGALRSCPCCSCCRRFPAGSRRFCWRRTSRRRTRASHGFSARSRAPTP